MNVLAASGVLANDSDRDGDSLTVTAVGGSSLNVNNSFATTYGHITIGTDGSYTYVADNTAAINAAPTGFARGRYSQHHRRRRPWRLDQRDAEHHHRPRADGRDRFRRRA